MGKFGPVVVWQRGIHYESAIVAHEGSTYCAVRDTAEAPPHEDWTLVAARGADAPVGTVHGRYDPERAYQKFDLVTFRNAEWRAKRDDPGPLPGDGWAISAQEGKRGDRGERGDRGDRGPAGPPGPAAPTIKEWLRDGYSAVPLMSDGSAGAALNVREFFELYHGEAR